jgi:hypothetical protein
MLRFTVIGLIASAALMLMKPTTFIDSVSWIIFAVVALMTILPNLLKPQTTNHHSSADRKKSPIGKIADFVSHPILLILLSGLAGYLIYR